MARLIIEPGTAAERAFTLHHGKTTIGRTADNDIALPDKLLSRLHAEIDVVGTQIQIVDLGSRNGTLVNGTRIRRATLAPGDVITIGGVDMTVEAGPSGESASPTLTRDIHTQYFPSGELGTPPTENQHEARLAVLLQVSQLLSSAEGLDATLARVLELALEVLGIDRAVVLLTNDVGHLGPRATRARVPLPPGQRIWSQGVVDYVMTHLVAAVFSDARADPRIDPSRSVMEQGIVASMCAPLKVSTRTLGVLYADVVLPGKKLTQEDVDLLAGFANQAALALDNALLHERLRRAAVMQEKLERFFPRPTAERILHSNTRDGLSVVETRATALFCDISGYTALTAGWPPRQVLDLLNEYFPMMAQAVFEHGGTLEKYIGDAVVAVWGVPYAAEDDADRALAAAIEMLSAVKGHRFGVHIGLHSGLIAAGNIGTESYVQYAAVGETTNLASRVSGVASEGEIVLSSETLAGLKNPPADLEALPPTLVKGCAQPLTLYRLRR
jgi:adenylate cyclase